MTEVNIKTEPGLEDKQPLFNLAFVKREIEEELTQLTHCAMFLNPLSVKQEVMEHKFKNEPVFEEMTHKDECISTKNDITIDLLETSKNMETQTELPYAYNFNRSRQRAYNYRQHINSYRTYRPYYRHRGSWNYKQQNTAPYSNQIPPDPVDTNVSTPANFSTDTNVSTHTNFSTDTNVSTPANVSTHTNVSTPVPAPIVETSKEKVLEDKSVNKNKTTPAKENKTCEELHKIHDCAEMFLRKENKDLKKEMCKVKKELLELQKLVRAQQIVVCNMKKDLDSVNVKLSQTDGK